jgi:hypothetical protein
MGVSHHYYACFKKVINKVNALEKSDGLIPLKINSTACRIDPSLLNILPIIK